MTVPRPPFDRAAYQSAHVLLDLLLEREVPLSRDVMRGIQRLVIDGDHGYVVGLGSTPWFPLPVEPTCDTCGAALAAERTVQVNDQVTSTRMLFDCGAGLAVDQRTAGDWQQTSRTTLAPCSAESTRLHQVAGDVIGRVLRETLRPVLAEAVTCAGCGGNAWVGGRQCPVCGGRGVVPRG